VIAVATARETYKVPTEELGLKKDSTTASPVTA
jgi:hypothetical protein